MSATTETITENQTQTGLQAKPCAHVACGCSAADNSDYCGTYCETAHAEHQHGDGCGCGHAECKQP